MPLALSICVLFISLIQLIKGAQFLNDTLLSVSSASLVAVSAPLPLIVIVPLTRIYASL